MVTKPPATRGPYPRRTEDDGFAQSRGVVEEPRRGVAQWRIRARVTLGIVRSNPTGRIALKVFIGIAGAVVVVLGLALIPLPGPGWALVILGLAIWAIEFVWAKHLLRFTRTRVQQWTRWVTRQPWPVRIALGILGALFVGAVLVLSLKYSFGIDLLAKIQSYVSTR